MFPFRICLPTAGDDEEPDLGGRSLCVDNKCSFRMLDRAELVPHPPTQVDGRLSTLLPQQLQSNLGADDNWSDWKCVVLTLI